MCTSADLSCAHRSVMLWWDCCDALVELFYHPGRPRVMRASRLTQSTNFGLMQCGALVTMMRAILMKWEHLYLHDNNIGTEHTQDMKAVKVKGDAYACTRLL
ncbi:hypothetical protein ElyMa_002471400 [Elysia marginata]|uniref:Uncharacterized protein n=1 Tax=Elysia marginata TaxID=1093978 RepID=A0AAV4GPP1_9GAST|nr:hypothetical protein ElyMa_002471400 [Elysia marginata]